MVGQSVSSNENMLIIKTRRFLFFNANRKLRMNSVLGEMNTLRAMDILEFIFYEEIL